MNIEKAFKFAFKGDNWIQNLLFVALLLLSGIGAFIVVGYGLQIIRDMKAANSDDIELPEWTDFGTYVMDGLKAIVVILVWSLPVILISFAFGIFSGLITSFASYDSARFLYVIADISQVFSGLISFVYMIALLGFLPTIFGELAMKQTIKSGIDFAHIFKINKGHFWSNILASIIGSVFSLIATIAGIIACLIGTIATNAISFAFNYHLFGQRYLDITGSAAAPSELIAE